MTDAKGAVLPVPPGPPGPGAAGDRVLVLVGDATLRAFLGEALRDAGYVVEATAEGATGTVAAATTPPVVILLDLARATRGGQCFAAWYRRQPGPPAPLLLLSTQDAAETATAASVLDAYGFLQLPFHLDELLAVVASTAGAAPGPPPEALPGVPAEPPAAKDGREAAAEALRRRLLERLGRDVWALRRAVAREGGELQRLAARAATGRLAPQEAARVDVLRREHEALRLQLRACAAEFERLRGGAEAPEAPEAE